MARASRAGVLCRKLLSRSGAGLGQADGAHPHSKLSEKRHVQHGKEEAAQIFSKAREDAEKAVMAARRKNSK